MKKIITIVLTAIISTGLFAGCGANNSTTGNKNASKNTDIVGSVKKDDSLTSSIPATYKSAGEIKIGVDDSYPPMEYRDDKNNLVGFDVDFGNAVGKKLGIKMTWVPTAWDGVIPALQSKKFDMILSSMSITDERKKTINFSDPYITGGPIIITKKSETSIKASEDLKGKIVGVQLGSTGEDALAKISGVKSTKKYDKIPEALQDLTAGRVEAVVADDQVGRYYMALAPNQFVVAAKMKDEPFGIGYRKEDSALTDVVQKAVNELKSDGTLSKISEKWFKTDIYK